MRNATCVGTQPQRFQLKWPFYFLFCSPAPHPILGILLLLSNLFKRHASPTQQYAGLQEGHVQRKITRSIKLWVTFKKWQFAILCLNWWSEVAIFASKGRLFHSIDALCLKLRFKKLVFSFRSARSISWFRKLYCLLRSLSLMSISLKHGEQFSLTILYSKTLFKSGKLT